MTTAASTGTPRKIRGDAKLAQLNPEQREILRIWLEDENRPYSSVVSCIRQSFGLQVSKSAIAMYYQRHLLPDHHDEHNEGAAVFAALSSGQFDTVTITHAKALAWAALACPVPQIDTATKLLTLVHRVEKQEIARERLDLEKQRVALRAQDLATHPPRGPRASPPESRPLHAPTPPPVETSSKATTHPQGIDPNPSALPALSAPSAFQTPPPPLNSTAPSPSTPDSSLPSLPSVQTLPPSSPPSPPPLPTAQAFLQKTPSNPPLFPASSSISQPPQNLPATPAQAAAPTTPPVPPTPLSPPPVLGSSPVKSSGESTPPATIPPIPAKPAAPRHTPWPHPDNPGRIRWP